MKRGAFPWDFHKRIPERGVRKAWNSQFLEWSKPSPETHVWIIGDYIFLTSDEAMSKMI